MGRQRDLDRQVLLLNGFPILPHPRSPLQVVVWILGGLLFPGLGGVALEVLELQLKAFTETVAELVLRPAGGSLPYSWPMWKTILSVLEQQVEAVEAGDAPDEAKAAVRREFGLFRSAFILAGKGAFTPRQYLSVLRRPGLRPQADSGSGAGAAEVLADAASRELWAGRGPGAFEAMPPPWAIKLAGFFGLMIACRAAKLDWVHTAWLTLFTGGLWLWVSHLVGMFVFSEARVRRRTLAVLAKAPEADETPKADETLVVWSLRDGDAATLARYDVTVLPGRARQGGWVGLEEFIETLPFLSEAILRAGRMSAVTYTQAHVRIAMDLIAEGGHARLAQMAWQDALSYATSLVEDQEQTGFVPSEALMTAYEEIRVFNQVAKDTGLISPGRFEAVARRMAGSGAAGARGRALAAAARGYVSFNDEKTAGHATIWYCALAVGAVLFALARDPMVPPALAAGAVGLGVVLFAVGQWLYSPASLRRGLARRQTRFGIITNTQPAEVARAA